MKNKVYDKKNNGISLVALIITIIVMVILAGIIINTSIKTPESASFAKFVSEMGALQDAVSLSYLDDFAKNPEALESDIYKQIATGEEYVGDLPSTLVGSTTAWRIASTENINGVDRLPDYGTLYLTDNGTVFLGGTGYAFGGDSYIAANIKYSESELENGITEEQINELLGRLETLENQVSTNTNNISFIPSTIENKILESYPVGSIYVSTSSINPSGFIGGAWEAYGQGKTLIGVGTGTDINSVSQEFTVESTGGEYKHNLTVAEMPKHTHDVWGYIYNSATRKGILPAYTVGIADTVITWNNINLTGADKVSIGEALLSGESLSHNNIQPYITVYMWKRIR